MMVMPCLDFPALTERLLADPVVERGSGAICPKEFQEDAASDDERLKLLLLTRSERADESPDSVARWDMD
jgi:hypothetical protein